MKFFDRIRYLFRLHQIVRENQENIRQIKNLVYGLKRNDEILIDLLGKVAIQEISRNSGLKSINDAEFKVFSQWGNDGILQFLIHRLDSIPQNFIEFGVENYEESNTRFLITNNNWSGLVIDASDDNIQKIKKSELYWKYNLSACCHFINAENINEIISNAGYSGDTGLLSIDIDGNDYWVWKSINAVRPFIVVIEYNSVFGDDRSITIPYNKDFFWTKAHYSNLYFGASLPALVNLGEKKGYSFIGSDSAGGNAYFVRNDVAAGFNILTAKQGYCKSNFRQSRDSAGELSYLNFEQQQELIRGLPVFNIMSNAEEGF